VGALRQPLPHRDPEPVIGTFELIASGDARDYAFHSAEVISIRKSREDDDAELAEDVAKLREVCTTKPTLRQPR
jgi:hypothetical protein